MPTTAYGHEIYSLERTGGPMTNDCDSSQTSAGCKADGCVLGLPDSCRSDGCDNTGSNKYYYLGRDSVTGKGECQLCQPCTTCTVAAADHNPVTGHFEYWTGTHCLFMRIDFQGDTWFLVRRQAKADTA